MKIKFKHFNESNEFKDLEEELLRHGGTSVKNVFEEDLEILLSDGEIFDCPVAEHSMEQSKCHRNCAEYYNGFMKKYNSPDEIGIATGWVLTGDVW